MNKEPWFNLDSESASLYQKLKEAEQGPSVPAFTDDVFDSPEPEQSADADDYGQCDARRFGNNRKKVPKSVAKAKRKAAKKSKQRNRK